MEDGHNGALEYHQTFRTKLFGKFYLQYLQGLFFIIVLRRTKKQGCLAHLKSVLKTS